VVLVVVVVVVVVAPLDVHHWSLHVW